MLLKCGLQVFHWEFLCVYLSGRLSYNSPSLLGLYLVLHQGNTGFVEGIWKCFQAWGLGRRILITRGSGHLQGNAHEVSAPVTAYRRATQDQASQPPPAQHGCGRGPQSPTHLWEVISESWCYWEKKSQFSSRMWFLDVIMLQQTVLHPYTVSAVSEFKKEHRKPRQNSGGWDKKDRRKRDGFEEIHYMHAGNSQII